MLDFIAEKIISNERVLISALGCAILYILISKERLGQRLVSGAAGFLAAVIFPPLLAETLSKGEGAHIYSAGIALCGQFVPQLIQTCITKIKHTDVYDFISRIFKK